MKRTNKVTTIFDANISYQTYLLCWTCSNLVPILQPLEIRDGTVLHTFGTVRNIYIFTKHFLTPCDPNAKIKTYANLFDPILSQRLRVEPCVRLRHACTCDACCCAQSENFSLCKCRFLEKPSKGLIARGNSRGAYSRGTYNQGFSCTVSDSMVP